MNTLLFAEVPQRTSSTLRYETHEFATPLQTFVMCLPLPLRGWQVGGVTLEATLMLS
jgi:hypothetical protein